MLDSRMSQLLRMQVHGAIYWNNETYTTNQLLTVNYPWVVANVDGQSIHLFPWLKDTRVTEGYNVYDFMPTNYDTGYKWIRDYLYGKTNVMAFSQESNLPSVLFPNFIEAQLLQYYPEFSIDDLGVRAVDRKHQYARWSEFPKPNILAEQGQIAVFETLGNGTNVLGWLSQIYDTSRFKVFRSGGSTALFDSGDLRTLDLHSRKFLVFTNGNKLNVFLDAFRPGTTALSGFTNDSSLLNTQLWQMTLQGTDNQFELGVSFTRHRAASTNATSYLGVIEESSTTNSFTYIKNEVAAFCMSVGRVSSAMMEKAAEAVWAVEGRKKTNAAYVPSLEDYHGSMAFLMGSTYYARLSAFDRFNQDLHKVRVVSKLGFGLAKIGAKTVSSTNYSMAAVDFIATPVTWAGNGSLHHDSAMDLMSCWEDYKLFTIVNGSAEEHNVINKFCGETNAISTVALLWLAQAKASPTVQGIVELNSKNYVQRGNQASAGYSGLLKNQDAQQWKSITNALGDQNLLDAAYVFMTPAPMTNRSGSYKGTGALV